MKSAVEVAVQLSKYYGYKLERPVVYTQGVALSGRLRLHELRPDLPDPSAEIAGMVAEYADDRAAIFSESDGTANFAGVCWADELAPATGNDKYLDLLKFTADLFGPTVDEGPLDPDIRVEDFFFAATMLGRAFHSTGDEKYADLLAEYLRPVDSTLQTNNLWWHCKASPYFWGRGNAFAALGFAEALTYLPDNHVSRPKLLETHLRHLGGLAERQDASGMWRQIIDMPSTFLEFSATAMIGYSIARGLRKGWLGSEWRSVADKTWDGLSQRIGPSGELEHACVGTGPLATLDEYINRPYSDGLDDRGGAVALWFAVEMARLESETGGPEERRSR